MRYAVLLTGLCAMTAGAAASPREVRAGPVVLAQADGGGIGGSLAAPATRAVRPQPRPSRAAAPRVVVKRVIVYQPRYIERPTAPAPRRSAPSGGGLASYDGAWTASIGGPCSAAGTGRFTVSGGRMMSPSGSGTVTPDGAVNTVSAFNGLTIVAQGHMNQRSASGIYRQSDGCTGSWSAVKL